jgi:hypothetical protein
MDSNKAVTEDLKAAIARALADPTRENILASLDAQHEATPVLLRSISSAPCRLNSGSDTKSWSERSVGQKRGGARVGLRGGGLVGPGRWLCGFSRSRSSRCSLLALYQPRTTTR